MSLSWSRIYGLKVTVNFGVGQCSNFHAASCHCCAPCHCLASCNCSGCSHCCHDAIIVRTASNFSTIPWFHSECASVSMFMINVDNCLFLLLFPLSPSLLRSFLCENVSGLQPVTRSITDFSLHLVVECGIHGLVEHQSGTLRNLTVLKQ